MKAFSLALLLCVIGLDAVAQEAASEEECKADPVAEEEAIAKAQRHDLVRAFVTVTEESVDDALQRTDAYWDAREAESFARVSTALDELNVTAEKRGPADWLEACHKASSSVGFSCWLLTDPNLRDICTLASASKSLSAGKRCAFARPEVRPACELTYEGRGAACEAAEGDAKAFCERVQAQLDRTDAGCGASSDPATCMGGLVLRAFGSGVEACNGVGDEVGVRTRGLVRRACRAVVERKPGRCPRPTDDHVQTARIEVLLRSRSGVPWLVVTGGSTGGAVCAIGVDLTDGDTTRQDVLVLDLTRAGRFAQDTHEGRGGALEAMKVRLGGDLNPSRATVRAASACVPAYPWTGPGAP